MMADGKIRFKVWAPRCSEVSVFETGKGRIFPMTRLENGYFYTILEELSPGDCYFYLLDGRNKRPDPVSRYQPEGVHGPSSIVNPGEFLWADGKWKGISWDDMIFYELHPGTFTPEGTLDAICRKIPYLKKLGITCVEIMPVSQFPGARNWGYDGVGLYAVQNTYGGPSGLKRLVNACHRNGLAVCLDVVYNHFGPEGNYLHDYGPYFTKKYHTPWGDALNYDDAGCGGVRHFMVSNALYWLAEYHIDCLRLDAVHGIFDFGARHILEEMNDEVQKLQARLGRPLYLVAESDLNDSKIIRAKRRGGYGLRAQWSDDFHHAVHSVVTGERSGYYEDFGDLSCVHKALRDGFVYDGGYSRFRKRAHGNPVRDLARNRLVSCLQNHDQVGNRAFGDRLAALAPFEALKAAASLLILSPFTPLLFMGEEYGEKSPFQYFVDHGDPDLVRAVRDGRTREFASFGWTDVPDPASPKTYADSMLKWDCLRKSGHRSVAACYRELIRLRKKYRIPERRFRTRFSEARGWVSVGYDISAGEMLIVLVSLKDQEIRIPAVAGQAKREMLFCSSGRRFGGPLNPGHLKSGKELLLPGFSAAVFRLSRKSGKIFLDGLSLNNG